MAIYHSIIHFSVYHFSIIHPTLLMAYCGYLFLTLLSIALMRTGTAMRGINGHLIDSQQSCVEFTRSRTYDCRWSAGLNANADQVILGGDVVAYKIRWFNGQLSLV